MKRSRGLWTLQPRTIGMPEVADLYTKGIKRKLKNYWAAWLPSTQFRIGDIGTLNGYVFERVGSLDELDVMYYAETSNDPSPLEIVSESSASLTFKAAGEVNSAFAHVPTGSAGMRIDFGAQGAFLMQAPETYEAAIGDPLNLQHQIITAFSQGIWEKDWVVVVRLVKAPSATILISKSSDASLELTAKTGFSPPLGGLGNANAEI